MKKQKTEELWRICFDDSEAFIRLFFDNVYRDDNTIIIEKDGKAVSALQFVPYTMLLEETEIPVAYICGVCTHPDERGKGLMSHLMSEVEKELSLRNIPCAALIPAGPWLFDVYRKYGYNEAFYYSREIYYPDDAPEKDPKHRLITETDSPGAYAYLDAMLRKRSACLLHSEAGYKIIRKDIEISGGKVLTITGVQNKVEGIAFTVPSESVGEARIIELLYNDESIKEQLLYETSRYYNTSRVSYITPPQTGFELPKGMIKVIDAGLSPAIRKNIQRLSTSKQACMTLMLD